MVILDGTQDTNRYDTISICPLELEHKAYLEIKEMNLDVDAARIKRRIQISD
jgi:hypothetical protein